METEKPSAVPMKSGKTVFFRSPIRSIFEKFSNQKDVEIVFGEPIEHADKKVVPVAKVKYLVGGGGGYSAESEKIPTAQGEGGGGHFSVTPVGVYEISKGKTRFKPVIDLKIIITLISLFTFVLTLLVKKRK
ncbi:GerW family sporulation protein [Fredinandcohnia sp. 179-A 10B2 NHS]|uniref:GerW family sporulation protein n=1 Tax=Fredinandcohnia sp. 179-A 10B2 NHS TaxID=3235176 RepID=UPI0039A03122